MPLSQKLSVRDMVNAKKICNDDLGIKGYDNPHLRFNPYTKRSLNPHLSQDKMDRDEISLAMKKSQKVPGPGHYKTNPAFGEKGKFFIPKGGVSINYVDAIIK